MRLTCLAAALVLASGASGAVAETALPRNAPQTLRELGPQWWRWRVTLPGMALPERDVAGHFCDIGQEHETWFVAGLLSFGSPREPVHRTCHIPSGRRLFFPVVTLMRVVHDDMTCSKAQAQVSSNIDRTTQLVATLDGVDLMAAGRTRWGSDGACFRLNLPADGPSSNLSAAADGYWVLLDPLPAGHHTLVYGGLLPSDRDDEVQSTTYDLEVE